MADENEIREDVEFLREVEVPEEVEERLRERDDLDEDATELEE